MLWFPDNQSTNSISYTNLFSVTDLHATGNRYKTIQKNYIIKKKMAAAKQTVK